MDTEQTLDKALNKLYIVLNMVEPTSLAYLGLLESIRILEDRLITLSEKEESYNYSDELVYDR